MSSARLGFIGVSTAQSLVNELFPRWSKTLGLGIGEVVGIDLPVNLTGDAIRSAVLRIQEDTSVSGALVTTHKVAVWEHTRDLFKKFDEHAQRLCEVSCLSRNPQGDLVGHAKDPITAGLAWDQVVSSYHWSRHPEAELLILGTSILVLAVYCGRFSKLAGLLLLLAQRSFSATPPLVCPPVCSREALKGMNN